MSDVTDLFEVDDGVVVLRVHAQPGAGRSAVVGRHGAAVKVRVPAPPAEARANTALVELLAKEFGLEPDAVALVSGETGPDKRFRLVGLDPDDAPHALTRILPQAGGSRPASRR
jgi:uncharacterized protein (TIGR00251 family)